MMKFIETGVTLKLSHVLKYQKTLYNAEMDDVINEMISYAESKKGIVKRILTITKGINFETGKQRLVVDFLLEMNQPTSGNNKFQYVSEYVLENCVVSKYKGHPQNASMATREVNEYIKKHELDPISPIHQVMKIDKKTRKKEKKKNEVDLEVYLAII
jgi:hypothetical protein